MNKSNYNFIWEKDSKTIAFNSMTCALAEVEDDFLNMLDKIENINYKDLNDKQKELFNNMKDGGYIVEDESYEIKELKFRNFTSRYQAGVLGLTIAPTLNCNFKCVYCYETPKNVTMTQDIQDCIIDVVMKQISTIKELDITWYGGEPLLCKDIIYNLSEKLIAICNENKIKYSAYMITNGYLLDDETIENYKKYKITGAQLTVDGPKDVHNSRRILKSGKDDNFDRVISAIKRLKENNLQPSVRINIDKSNIQYLDNLLETFKNNGMLDVGIHLGQVTEYTKACKSISSCCYDTEEFSNLLIEFQKKLNKNGFKGGIGSVYYPSLRGNYCGADQINSFVIDPEGYIYKCWNEIGNIDRSNGNIKDIKEEKIPEAFQFNNTLDYMSYSPFDSEKCLDCKLLPMCMGGCPYFRVNGDSEACERWKYNLEEIIKYTCCCNEEYPEEFEKAFGNNCKCC